MKKSELKTLFKELKSIALNDISLTLWLVNRSLRNRVAHYKVSWVQTDGNLKKKLNHILKKQIARSNSVSEYGYITEDQDATALNVSINETDFSKILPELHNGSDANKINDINDLHNTWAYIIEVKNSNHHIFAFKKVPESWSLKKSNKLDNVFFDNAVLKDLQEKSIFKISRSVDFIAYKQELFILDKKNFESGLNFRVGMEKNRDKVLNEFKQLKLFDDTSKLKEKVGNNIKYLRKISTIKKNGYYKNQNYMKALKVINESEKWGLEIEDGKIKVEDNNIDLILTLLNNDRVKSLINDEIFDAVVKKPV